MTGWKWMKVFEDSDRTFMVGTSFNPTHGLTIQFMVRIGDKAQPCGTLEHALMMFNQNQPSNVIVAKQIPSRLNGGLPIKKKSR